jgi:hypothetical protein
VKQTAKNIWMPRHKHSDKVWDFGVNLIRKCPGTFVGETVIDLLRGTSMSQSIKNFKTLLGWFYLGIALTVLYSVLHHRGFLPEPSMWLNIIRSETIFVPNYEKSQDSQVNTPLMQLIPKGTPVHLLVEKSARKLSVYSSGKWIKSYPVVFGSENTHPKIVEGDMRTPEGLYRVIDV